MQRNLLITELSSVLGMGVQCMVMQPPPHHIPAFQTHTRARMKRWELNNYKIIYICQYSSIVVQRFIISQMER